MRALSIPCLAALFASVSMGAAACGGGEAALGPGIDATAGDGGSDSSSSASRASHGGSTTGSSTTGRSASGSSSGASTGSQSGASTGGSTTGSGATGDGGSASSSSAGTGGSSTGGSATGDGGSGIDGGSSRADSATGDGGGSRRDAGADGGGTGTDSAASSSISASSGSSGSSTSASSGSGSSSAASSGSGASSAGSSSSSGATLTACTSDAQCSGTTCQIIDDTATGALALACEPIVGSGLTGASCTDGSACRDGLCIGGYCSAACTSAADCSASGSCQSQTVTVGGLNGTFDVCVVVPCTAPSSCPAGEVCTDVQEVAGNPKAFCQSPIAGGAADGAACTSGATCASALCPTWLLTCTSICQTAADCTATPGEVCVDMFGGLPSLEACAPGCSRDADCTAAGTTCVFTIDTDGNQNVFSCAPPFGPSATGTDCATQDTCASGVCLSNYSDGQLTDQICTQPCVTSADCPAAYPACVDMETTTPDGSGSQLLSVCDHT